MGIDANFLASLLDCIDGKKSDGTLSAVRLQIKEVLSNGAPKKDKLLLSDILLCIDGKTKTTEGFRVKTYEITKRLVEERTLERNNEIKLRHSSGTVGAGATFLE